MHQVHFHAAFNLQTRCFDVSVTTGGHRYVETMSVVRYEQFCKDLDKGIMVIGGMKVIFKDDREVADGQVRTGPAPFELLESEAQDTFIKVNAYFNQVLYSYRAIQNL